MRCLLASCRSLRPIALKNIFFMLLIPMLLLHTLSIAQSATPSVTDLQKRIQALERLVSSLRSRVSWQFVILDCGARQGSSRLGHAANA